MKLSIERDQLADTIGWTARALPIRPAIPVLTGLHIHASHEGVTVSAFGYNTSRRATTPADVAEPGTVVLPGRVLAEVVKSLPADMVDITLDRTEVTIRSGRARFTLTTLAVDDYPALPDLPEPTGTVDGQELAAAFTQVAPATSNDDTLPMLTGIRADLTSTSITLAATDRYRIATTTIGWQPGNLTGETGLVIPGRPLADTVKGLTGTATLHLGSGLAAITTEQRTTTIHLLDAQYVDYASRVGTEGHTTWAEIEAAPLVDAVKRVALVAERHAPVRLAFGHHDVAVRAGGGEIGRGSELVDGVTLDGPPLEIAFQPKYLLDGIAHVPGDRVRIGMTTPVKPALITPADPQVPFRYLVMPIHTATQ